MLAEIQTLKDLVFEETEAFGRKLDSEVRKFVRDTRSSKDQIRAVIRCLSKCIKIFTRVGKLVYGDGIVAPAANESEELGKDELRSTAGLLLKFFKNVTLESFLTAVYPADNADYTAAKNALTLIRDTVLDNEVVINNVMNDGYDCLSNSEGEEASEDDEEEASEDKEEEASEDEEEEASEQVGSN